MCPTEINQIQLVRIAIEVEVRWIRVGLHGLELKEFFQCQSHESSADFVLQFLRAILTDEVNCVLKLHYLLQESHSFNIFTPSINSDVMILSVDK